MNISDLKSYKVVKTGNPAPSEEGYLSRVGSTIKNSLGEAVDSEKKSISGQMNPFAAGLNIAKNVTGAVAAPLTQAPGFKQVGEGFSKVGQAIVDTKMGNKVTDALSKVPGQVLGGASDFIETGLNVGTIEGVRGGTKSGVSGAIDKTSKVVEQGKNVISDVVPNSERIINHQVTKALDLTQADVKNIAQSTGNEVGKWVAEKNLIGKNVAETTSNVKSFFEQSYKQVRDEIGRVKKTYKQYNLPRFVDALKAVKQKITDVPGLEKVNAEISNLLAKKDLTLSEYQRAKELLDEHFSIYKATGDVGSGVAKEGLSNMRSDIKKFIESEVKKETGADIKQLNNDVSTAKGIGDAIETRSTAGLTRSNLKMGDFGAFGLGFSFGGPLGGIAGLFMKKLAESPSVQLRIAKYMDSISDAKKAKIKAEMEGGKIPQEFNQFIKGKH